MSEGKPKPSAHLITRPLLAGAVALSVLPAVDANADIFLQIAGIPGESTNETYKDAIVVNSFSDGFLARTAAGGGVAVGKSSCGPVQFTKQLDLASLPLISTLMTGKMLDKAVFSFTAQAGDFKAPQAYYVVTLQHVAVSAVTQDSGGERPSESVEFLPASMQFKYIPQSATGKVSSPTTITVDCTSRGAGGG